MKLYFTYILIVLFGVFFAQDAYVFADKGEFRTDTEFINPNPDKINDAEIKVNVYGGKKPYKYYWSKEDVDTLSNSAKGLVEGISYTVTVKDATGKELTNKIHIPSKGITEKFNGFFVPVVKDISKVLFFDVFTALGIYNPLVYDDNGVIVKNPNGSFQKKNIPFIVVWLVVGAIFFTIRMGFINFRGIRHALNLVRGKYDDPTAPGRVTHFQALATAVSGTVGLGNIAGVAVAVSLGGAGATFWMIMAGLLGMSTKFVECTLGVKYRHIEQDGRVFGGPMNYLSKGLEKRGMKGLGKVLAVVFAILAVGASFGGGNMFQANQSFEQLASQFPTLEGYGFWFGIVSAIMVGAVIIGGINSIAKVTEKIVPFMASIYVLAALIVIGVNIQNVGSAFQAIIDGAFSPSALKGGVIGVLIVGFQRAAFSNEAGVGSAAIAHSAAKTNHPPSEGFVALLEPFLDTVVICTLTALVLIFTGMDKVQGLAGATLTSDAFGSVISWFPMVLAFAVFLFAFSTMISWSYYGMRAWTYLFGKSKRAELIYKLLFLVFVVVGASISLGAVLDFSDMMVLAMAFPNIIGLYILAGEVKQDLKDYMERLKKGELFKK